MAGYGELFWTFAKVGVMTFGGGYAMLPLLKREIVNKHGWSTEEELLDTFAISQVIPGIIAVNTANFVGHKQKGRLGALAAVLGMLAPSIIIISIIFHVLQQFQSLSWVQNAFSGVRIVVGALILYSVISMAKKALIDWFTVLLFAAAAVLLVFFKVNPVWVVLVGALLGVLKKRLEVKK